jgi:GntR family transcriptional regulator
MPIEFTPPKYAVIVNTLQERIGNGTYPPGSTLPSETALMREFSVSRPTAVRALELLRQQGWVEAQQGRGRTVIGSPESRGRRPPGYVREVLGLRETALVKVVSAGPVLAPPRAAAGLEIPAGTAVIARCRVVSHEQLGPIEVSTLYLPVELAAGTQVSNPVPLAEGVLVHLTRLRAVEFDHAVQRVSAKLPTPDECELLGIGRRDVLLTTLMTVFDRVGKPSLAIDTLLPVGRRELEDAFTMI